jgi:poly(3-hydroxybutyrate) depolymerase
MALTFGRHAPASLVRGFALAALIATQGSGCSNPAVRPSADGGSGTDSGSSDARLPEVDAGIPAPDANVVPEPPWVAPVLGATSAGCGAGAGTATGNAGRVVTTPSGRNYLIVVPADYDRAKAYPTVLAYHGWYTNGSGFKGWFEFERWVKSDGILIYPYADNPSGAFDLSGDRDLLAFDEITAQVQKEYCINPQRTFVLGFSFGGKFTNHLACKRAGYVRAASIGDASAGDDNADRSCGRLPMLITHRTADTDERYDWGKANAGTWATRNGCTANAAAAATPGYQCQEYGSCKTPGSTMFCTDTENLSNINGYEPSWDHTITWNYRDFTWKWFQTFQ